MQTGMGMQMPNLEKIILEFCSKFISEKYPEEIPFIKLSWEIFAGVLRQWKDKHPQIWPVQDYQDRMQTEFGFAGKIDELELITPKLIATVSASVLHLSLLGETPDRSTIQQILQHYAGKVGAPTFLKSEITEYFTRFLEMDFTKIAQLATARVPSEGIQPAGGDSLYLGIERGVPYVRINQFRCTDPPENVFAVLLFFAAVREKYLDNGWVSKDQDPIKDLGSGEQWLSRIRRYLQQELRMFQPHLKGSEILKSGTQKTLRLEGFKFIDIDKSVCDFISRHESVVRDRINKVYKIYQYRQKNGKVDTVQMEDILSLAKIEDVNRFIRQEVWPLKRQVNLVWEAVKIKGLEFRNENWREEWKDLMEKFQEIYKLLLNLEFEVPVL